MARDIYYRVAVKVGPVEYDLSHDLTSFTVEEEAGKPDRLTIDVSDPYKVLGHGLKEGTDIEVDLGHVDDHSLVFRGHIYRLEGQFPRDEVPQLKVIAYDSSAKLGLAKRSRHRKGSLTAIIDNIVAAYPAYFDGSSVQLAHEPSFNGRGLRQNAETDLAFLRRLAATYNCELYVTPSPQKSVLHFESQARIMEKQPLASVYHGRCDVSNRLIRFQPNVDVSKVELPRVFCGIDFAQGTRLELKSQAPAAGGKVADVTFAENRAAFHKEHPVRAQQLARLLAAVPSESQLLEKLREERGHIQPEVTPCFTTGPDLSARQLNGSVTRVHGMRATGTTVGNHRIHAQATMDIAAVGGRFSGTWYVSKVRHLLNGQGYKTEFDCQR